MAQTPKKLGAGSFTESNLASAATCDLASVDTVKVNITGTTTITSFGTGTNKIRFLRFAGALTLTHHATSLILPAGANIATAAGDTCWVMSDGSANWRVYSYQRASGYGVAPQWRPLAWSTALSEVNNEGITTEKVLATIPIPANSIGPSGMLRIWTLWDMTNNANNKTPRVRFGASGAGTGGTAYAGSVMASQQSYHDIRLIANKTANSQIAWGVAAGAGGGWGTTTGALVTSAIDTTAASEIVLSGQLATATDRLSLQRYLVEILHGT